ncbi:MAG: sigma-70 family RNA polymerase sigma factor [Candidatus Pseudobacter hemicellulosilyticus]|uniref:Sigma-70 family RNA polymerase sigma factor n=1 Tax=Candidatus Pseudobacter hemicellulosilyticus TaxID=3121375 RepID=A0AAJ6BH38_9BACT|nr:MAG: sigma-70 family RNA polymerase sigma factor [Pseudobacter sp.]
MNDITGIRLNEGSFREVYDQFHAKAFRYFLKRTSRQETATELTQQLFIKLWQSRHTLSAAHSLDIQLFTMANSVWIDHLRKEATSRKYFSMVDDFEPMIDSMPASTGLPGIEARDHLRLAMHQLSPVRRKVFILKMMHGFSNQEIAGKLSVSVKTVEDHLWKAMRLIRSFIATLWTFLLFSLSWPPAY